jgi:hypothetical protein
MNQGELKHLVCTPLSRVRWMLASLLFVPAVNSLITRPALAAAGWGRFNLSWRLAPCSQSRFLGGNIIP